MEKKIAWVVGCVLLYLILLYVFGGIINAILFAGGLAYLIWKNNR